jgi:threonine/homoserine/homoserine lactone efflux protein
MIITFLITAILLTLSPGPDILYVLSLSLKSGAKKGMFLAFGLVTGIIIHTSLLAFGFSAIINQNPIIFNSIKWLGATYLFYLAFRTYQAESKINITTTKNSNESSISLIKRGFLMNVLNPKVTLFFLSFFPKFIETDQNTIIATYKLGFLFMFQAFIIFSIVAFLAEKLKHKIDNPSFHVFIKWFQIVVLIGIGIFVLL